jgi:hypothetical protein
MLRCCSQACSRSRCLPRVRRLWGSCCCKGCTSSDRLTCVGPPGALLCGITVGRGACRARWHRIAAAVATRAECADRACCASLQGRISVGAVCARRAVYPVPGPSVYQPRAQSCKHQQHERSSS